jgi:hypothetical protein
MDYTKGQPVEADMTGLGHAVRATYVRPLKVSKSHPLGGHVLRTTHPDDTVNTEFRVSRDPKAL